MPLALSDMFGKTIQIDIVDFLCQNFGQWYNVTELSACVEHIKEDVFEVLPQLIYDGLILYKIEENICYYTMSKEYLRHINVLVFANSFRVANLEEFDIELESIKKMIGDIPDLEEISVVTPDNYFDE
jgi:hypothetical protein